MNIETFYQDFIESEHRESTIAAAAINSAPSDSAAQSVTDGIEEELNKGFVFGFIAGIDFMKGAIR